MFNKREIALSILNRDRIVNANFINFIETYHMDEFHIIGNSVLGRGKSDRNWIYISSNEVSEFERLITYLHKEDKCFAVLDDWMIPHIANEKDVLWQLRCEKLICLKEIVCMNKGNIRVLRQEDATYIYNNSDYQEYISIDYIQERIKNGIGIGIHKNNKLVAWVLTHDDGAIGFLNVLKEYRRKGYAKELTIAIVKKIREIGKIPFLHIEEDNSKSMNLASKIGFTKHGVVNWIELR